VRAALRRRNAVNQWHTFGLGDGDVIVNEGVYVRPDGERVELSVHEMKLLVTLANAQGAVVSRDELSDRVWGKAEQQSRFVDVTVRRTRVKIEPNPEDPELLLTARGRGYRLFGVQRAGA
jgi:DNA-binding response OmpR family regulator